MASGLDTMDSDWCRSWNEESARHLDKDQRCGNHNEAQELVLPRRPPTQLQVIHNHETLLQRCHPRYAQRNQPALHRARAARRQLRTAGATPCGPACTPQRHVHIPLFRCHRWFRRMFRARRNDQRPPRMVPGRAPSPSPAAAARQRTRRGARCTCHS